MTFVELIHSPVAWIVMGTVIFLALAAGVGFWAYRRFPRRRVQYFIAGHHP